MHDDYGLVSRSGFLGRKVDAFLFRKAESVAATQSPLQARKRLATSASSSRAGSVRAGRGTYPDLGVACRLRDYALHKADRAVRAGTDLPRGPQVKPPAPGIRQLAPLTAAHDIATVGVLGPTGTCLVQLAVVGELVGPEPRTPRVGSG